MSLPLALYGEPDSLELKNGVECPCCKRQVPPFRVLEKRVEYIKYQCYLCHKIFVKYSTGKIQKQ